MELRCSQSLCKAAIPAPDASDETPWPLVCPECLTALYPADVLARMPEQELQPNRSVLLVVKAGGLVDANEADVRGETEPAVDGASMLDMMLDAAEPAPAPAVEESSEAPAETPGAADLMAEMLDAEEAPAPEALEAKPSTPERVAEPPKPEATAGAPGLAILVVVIVLVLVGLLVYVSNS